MKLYLQTKYSIIFYRIKWVFLHNKLFEWCDAEKKIILSGENWIFQ